MWTPYSRQRECCLRHSVVQSYLERASWLMRFTPLSLLTLRHAACIAYMQPPSRRSNVYSEVNDERFATFARHFLGVGASTFFQFYLFFLVSI